MKDKGGIEEENGVKDQDQRTTTAYHTVCMYVRSAEEESKKAVILMVHT